MLKFTPRNLGQTVFVAGLATLLFYPTSGKSGGLYDVSSSLSAAHPFASAPQSPKPQFRPAAAALFKHFRRAGDGKTVMVTKDDLADRGVRPRDGQEGNIVSEVRAGVLAHDFGPFSSHKESGVDGNLEILFTAPKLLDAVFSPRPHIGVVANSAGGTSQAYAGLTWEWDLSREVFLGASFGGAVHTGNTSGQVADGKNLGCLLLFRGSVELGFRLTDKQSVTLHFAHMSNANLCAENEGLENIGFRYGYRF